MADNNVVLRFDKVSFAFNDGKHPILKEASFSVRKDTKITIMGQNGAGKTTLFKLIRGELKPQKGKISIDENMKIAISKQVIPRNQLDMTVKEYFETAFEEKDYQIDKKIADVLQDVNLTTPIEWKTLRNFSGGQQARLLLAHAIIQDPDILLLDEPTNNLDADGIGDLIGFLYTYIKTVIVISHDADFLNLFTEWVLYLNKDRLEVEQYWGDYNDVLEKISAQIEKERMQNARAAKEIQDAKDKINFFSNKWGKMRKLASKMRDNVAKAEENKVDIRRDDKTIPRFEVETENYVGPLVSIKNISMMNENYEVQNFPLNLEMKKKQRYIIKWPNGIGKSTFLKNLMTGKNKDAYINSDVKIGYYSQDFDELNMDMIVWDSIQEVTNEVTDEVTYNAWGRFLLKWELLKGKVGWLSEWQKGLLCYARFLIQKPHLLVLDEPTNHINFRHLPVIAEALNNYEGTIIMVSHDEPFVEQIKDLVEIDLGKLRDDWFLRF